MSDGENKRSLRCAASRRDLASTLSAHLRHDQRAHLYGFPSPDSDYDLRGCHLLPVREVVGLDRRPGDDRVVGGRRGLEIDLVTHDAGKFFQLTAEEKRLCAGAVVLAAGRPRVGPSIRGAESRSASLASRGITTTITEALPKPSGGSSRRNSRLGSSHCSTFTASS